MRYFKTSLHSGFEMIFEISKKGFDFLNQWYEERKELLSIIGKELFKCSLLHITYTTHSALPPILRNKKEIIEVSLKKYPQRIDMFSLDGSNGIRLISFHRPIFYPDQFTIEEDFLSKNIARTLTEGLEVYQ